MPLLPTNLGIVYSICLWTFFHVSTFNLQKCHQNDDTMQFKKKNKTGIK